MSSVFLDNIIKNSNRCTNLQVVYFDVVRYSERRTQNQINIIDSFMECIKNALSDTSKAYLDYCQKNNVNFSKDIIYSPAGDGAAIIFPFEGLHNIHLFFAKSLLNHISLTNSNDCEKFNKDNWCNCHKYFSVRVGISEGKGIIYKDINDNYSVAGNVINLAARVMSFANYNQIIFTENAYKQIIDLDDKPDLINNFIEFRNVKTKHSKELNIYIYREEELGYINSNPDDDLVALNRIDSIMENMNDLKINFSPKDRKINGSNLADFMESMVNLLKSADS